MATKVDHKRELACYRAKRDTPQLVDVPDLQYLMIDGHGDPNTTAYSTATATLYPVAYSLKFASKTVLGRDYVVMPLEGLWWADDMDSFTVNRDKSRWDWTQMIMVPDWITSDMFTAAVEKVTSKKDSPAHISDLRLETLSEGQCVQALHLGSFDNEAGLLERMHDEFIPSMNLTMSGKHHEIYFSDPRKTDPDKLRTILRQPVSSARD